MLESKMKKKLLTILHNLLFIIISWTIFNSAVFIYSLVEFKRNPHLDNVFKPFVYFYFLGGSDFFNYAYDMFLILFTSYNGESVWTHIPVWIYLAAVLGTSFYLWCEKQTIFRAWILAMAGCLAGPCALNFLTASLLWLYGVAGITAGYLILWLLNYIYFKNLPLLGVSKLLGWRKPNLISSFFKRHKV